MSLYESLDPTEPVSPEATLSSPAEAGPDLLAMLGQPQPSPLARTFHDLLKYVMNIREEKEILTERGPAFCYRGTLLRPARDIFPKLSEAIEAHGYSLYMQRSEHYDEVLIIEGVMRARNIRTPWWFHLGLLLATVLTTLVAAALLNGYTIESIRVALSESDRLLLLRIYQQARLFAFPLLFILGVHEMGHYIAARLHGVKVTLPFFVPLPFWGSLGTLGAVIFIKSPFHNRKQLFDVGIAGPLAGLLVAIPIFLIGLDHTPATSLFPRQWLQAFNRVSIPPLLEFVASFVRDDNQVAHLDRNVFYNHPVALAAWFGVLLTSLNLLPMGQFDGGHVAFAVLGRRIAWPLARVTALGCVMLGLTGFLGITEAWPIWFIWPLFAYLTGLRHPPPHDDITPLGWPRTVLGIVTFGLLLTMLVITPFYSTLR